MPLYTQDWDLCATYTSDQKNDQDAHGDKTKVLGILSAERQPVIAKE